MREISSRHRRGTGPTHVESATDWPRGHPVPWRPQVDHVRDACRYEVVQLLLGQVVIEHVQLTTHGETIRQPVGIR